MDRREYEYLQERLSRLISTDRYLSRNKSQEYRDGVLAAKSALKAAFYKLQEEGQE